MNGFKIGVLTFHRCINYGSFWQARCLVEGLRSLGHDAVILDHYSPRVNFAEWKCALNPVLLTSVPASDRPLYKNKIYHFFQSFKSLPLSEKFSLVGFDKKSDYDLIIVGSDEVWNLFHPWYGKCGLFFGDGLHAKRLVSYAASFGNYDSKFGLPDEWANKLLNFEMISVRDNNSQQIIKNALGYNPEMVLDPCLQFPINPEERNCDQHEQSYLALYGHNFTKYFIKQVRTFGKQNKLTIISIGYRNDWADTQWIDADPHEFAHFITHSFAVVTNFFHGCIFAIRNLKPFVCEASSYRHIKLNGLLTAIEGEEHLLSDSTSTNIFFEKLSNPVSPDIIQKIIRLRQQSTVYLQQVLSDKQIRAA